jgi:integrase
MLAILQESNPGTELEPWRTHDLRRTAASGMSKIGIEPHVIERVLNHIQGGLRAVYQQYQYLPERRDGLVRWGQYIDGIVSR